MKARSVEVRGRGMSTRGNGGAGMATGGVRLELRGGVVLTVNSCFEVYLDLQSDKSPVVVKGPFFPQVVNPRYRICGTNV
jgi:hypothetical protein